MTPARRRRIEELFAGAIRFDSAGLASWFRRAYGDVQELQVQVGYPPRR
jgi:hypothetical protein